MGIAGRFRDILRSIENSAAEFVRLSREAPGKQTAAVQADISLDQGGLDTTDEGDHPTEDFRDSSHRDISDVSFVTSRPMPAGSLTGETTADETDEDDSPDGLRLARQEGKLEGLLTQIVLEDLALDNIVTVELLALDLQVVHSSTLHLLVCSDRCLCPHSLNVDCNGRWHVSGVELRGRFSSPLQQSEAPV